jgi:hypothetical protein
MTSRPRLRSTWRRSTSPTKAGTASCCCVHASEWRPICPQCCRLAPISSTPTKNSKTALHFSAHEGHLDVVQALLKAGANVDAKDVYSKTSLTLAAHQGHLDVVQALLKAGAKVDEKDVNSYTALHEAAYEGHIDAKGWGGVTALSWAKISNTLQSRRGGSHPSRRGRAGSGTQWVTKRMVRKRLKGCQDEGLKFKPLQTFTHVYAPKWGTQGGHKTDRPRGTECCLGKGALQPLY